MGNGSDDFANNVRDLTLTKFCSYFPSFNNHENPCRLVLQILYNKNEIQD